MYGVEFAVRWLELGSIRARNIRVAWSGRSPRPRSVAARHSFKLGKAWGKLGESRLPFVVFVAFLAVAQFLTLLHPRCTTQLSKAPHISHWKLSQSRQRTTIILLPSVIAVMQDVDSGDDLLQSLYQAGLKMKEQWQAVSCTLSDQGYGSIDSMVYG